MEENTDLPESEAVVEEELPTEQSEEMVTPLPPTQASGPSRGYIVSQKTRELASRANAAATTGLFSLGGMLEPPTEEANGDDLSDLFKGPTMDDPDMRTDDLLAVSEEDVIGEDGGDMSDLTEVSPEDIMGDEGIDDLFEPLPPVRTKLKVSKMSTPVAGRPAGMIGTTV